VVWVEKDYTSIRYGGAAIRLGLKEVGLKPDDLSFILGMDRRRINQLTNPPHEGYPSITLLEGARIHRVLTRAGAGKKNGIANDPIHWLNTVHGPMVRKMREEAKITVLQFSNHVSVSAQTTHKWERAESTPDYRNRKALYEFVLSVFGMPEGYQQRLRSLLAASRASAEPAPRPPQTTFVFSPFAIRKELYQRPNGIMELAKVLHVGGDDIQDWMSGATEPTSEQITAIARFFGYEQGARHVGLEQPAPETSKQPETDAGKDHTENLLSLIADRVSSAEEMASTLSARINIYRRHLGRRALRRAEEEIEAMESRKRTLRGG